MIMQLRPRSQYWYRNRSPQHLQATAWQVAALSPSRNTSATTAVDAQVISLVAQNACNRGGRRYWHRNADSRYRYGIALPTHVVQSLIPVINCILFECTPAALIKSPRSIGVRKCCLLLLATTYYRYVRHAEFGVAWHCLDGLCPGNAAADSVCVRLCPLALGC